MAHYEERTHRAANRKSTAADLKSQLATLKSDLAHFQASRASASLMESVKERIRQIEAHLAAEAAGRQGPRA